MASSPRPGMVAVKLTSIPVKVRRRHGQRLYDAAVADRDLTLAVQLHSATEEPSERTFWVPRVAYEKASARW